MTLPLVPPPHLTGVEFVNYLYAANISAPYNPATIKGSWDRSSNHIALGLAKYPSGASASKMIHHNEFSMADYDEMFFKYVSQAFFAPVTITGTLSWVLGAYVNQLPDSYWRIHVWVSAGDSTTARGTLVTFTASGLAFSRTSARGRSGAVVMSSVAAQQGDRIVIELGSWTQDTGNVHDCTMYYGNIGSTSLANEDTNVTTRPGWFLFPNGLPLYS